MTDRRIDPPADPYVSLYARSRVPQRLEPKMMNKSVEAPNRLMVRAYLSADQSISNNVGGGTNVLWDAETFDYGGLHSLTSNTDRLVIPAGKTTGVWHIKTKLRWVPGATGASGARETLIQRVGSVTGTVAGYSQPGLSTTVDQDYEISSFVLDPQPGDYFFVNVFQNSGGSLNIGGGAGFVSYFELVHLW